MINRKRLLAIIPARGGSKRLPRKNILELGGKPLIAWTIEEARKSVYLDRIIVSTDDREIAEVAAEWGAEVPFFRPPHLAEDHTSGLEPIFHALDQLKEFDYIVLLQPTSPLRVVADIDACIERCIDARADSCVSFVLNEKPPSWLYEFDEQERIIPFLDGDDSGKLEASPLYLVNGAVYVAEVESLKRNQSLLTSNTVGYVMPRERSVDIDTELDFRLSEVLLSSREKAV